MLALALLVFLVGSFLPVRHSVTVAREVAATPEEAWNLIGGVEDFSAWRPGVARATAESYLDALAARTGLIVEPARRPG